MCVCVNECIGLLGIAGNTFANVKVEHLPPAAIVLVVLHTDRLLTPVTFLIYLCRPVKGQITA